ncbi:MAG TPA: signal peptidase I [Acidimicrobiia bacterium]|nr:signal peptidase I [Acidimicrobiia bacterium]
MTPVEDKPVSAPEYMADVPTVAVAPTTPRVDPPATIGAPRVPHSDGGSGQRTRRIVVEWVLLIGGALLIAFLIKTFLFQAFYIPSESMTPTLNVGDRVLVNKLSYRLHDVNRGDIVVFEAPDDPNTDGVKDLVKRVVGLPGETVELRDGQVFVDGSLLEEPYLQQGEVTRPTQNFAGKCEPPASDATCVVPADSYLVLGDNRDQSKDGRVFGPIRESDIIGRVFVRIWPLGDLGFL